MGVFDGGCNGKKMVSVVSVIFVDFVMSFVYLLV